MVLAAMLTMLLAQATFAAQTPLFTDPEATPPSPPPSICPSTEVAQVTPHGPIPSATPLKQTGPPYLVYATVLVTVNPDGSVKDAVLEKHSGFSGTDSLAVQRARRAVYRPKTVNCAAVEGTYLFFYASMII